MSPGNRVVLFLTFTLLILVVALVFFYKKLNKETNNQYTVERIIYMEGGVRDRVRGAASAVEALVGIQLWPRGDEEQEEEVQDEERDLEAGASEQGSDTDGEDEQEEDSLDHSGSTKEKNGDDSSVDSLETGEEDRLVDNNTHVKEEVVDNKQIKQEAEVKVEGKAEASGGTGLLIDLKQFSGSAIWSEEPGGEGQHGDVTAL